MTKFDELSARRFAQYKNEFKADALFAAGQNVIDAYNRGYRIKVIDARTPGEKPRCGTVGVTTGWHPSFLLMRNSRAIGSSDLLNEHTRVIGVKFAGDKEYRPLTFDVRRGAVTG